MPRYVDLDNPKIISGERDRFGLVVYHIPPDTPCLNLAERPKGYMKIKVISAVDGEDLFCENCDAYCLSSSYNFCPKCGVEFIGVRGEQDE